MHEDLRHAVQELNKAEVEAIFEAQPDCMVARSTQSSSDRET